MATKKAPPPITEPQLRKRKQADWQYQISSMDLPPIYAGDYIHADELDDMDEAEKLARALRESILASVVLKGGTIEQANQWFATVGNAVAQRLVINQSETPERNSDSIGPVERIVSQIKPMTFDDLNQ